jgi:hypothetical protein
VVSFTPHPLYTNRNSPWYLLYRRLDGLITLSGCYGKEENSLPLLGIEPQPSSPQPISHQLGYLNSISPTIPLHKLLAYFPYFEK